MAYINNAFQDIRDTDASGTPSRYLLNQTILLANMTIRQIDNQNAIDELAQDFYQNLYEEEVYMKTITPFF